jgi:hypothetical protein
MYSPGTWQSAHVVGSLENPSISVTPKISPGPYACAPNRAASVERANEYNGGAQDAQL